METVDTVIFRAISEIRGKLKRPDEARIYNFVKDFLDDSSVSDGSFWEIMKTFEDQRVIINTPTKCGSSFFLPLHELSDSNSNTINTTPTVSIPSNIPVCPKNDKDVSLLGDRIDYLEQFFDTQLQNLTQISPVKSSSKGTNTNSESDILIKSLQGTILILKKELINKESTIKNLSTFLENITSNTYKISPLNKDLAVNQF